MTAMAVDVRTADASVDAGHEAQPPLPLPTVRLASDAFLGELDALIRDRMRHQQPLQVKRGGGGRSLGFKLDFADGTRAYFKPEQTFSGANYRAEIAAYHLDRVLGLGRVPPVVSRSFAWEILRDAAGEDSRVAELVIQPDGTLRGALIYWLPEPMAPAKTPNGFENWLRVETFTPWAISPYKRPAEYAKALRRNRELVRRNAEPDINFEQVPVLTDPKFAQALSDMIIFDFLTLNVDRWGGDNANVLAYGKGQQTLIFLDNGAGFSPGPPTRGLLDDRLLPLQRFRRSTIEALRKLDFAELWARLDGEPLAPILSGDDRAALAVRRDKVLEHVAAMQAKFGDAVYAW